jgi:hypothetical protein
MSHLTMFIHLLWIPIVKRTLSLWGLLVALAGYITIQRRKLKKVSPSGSMLVSIPTLPTSHRVASHRITSHHITSHHITTQHITWHGIIPYSITWHQTHQPSVAIAALVTTTVVMKTTLIVCVVIILWLLNRLVFPIPQVHDESINKFMMRICTYVNIGRNCLTVCVSVCMYLDVEETSVVIKVMPWYTEWRSRAGPMIQLWLVFSESRDRYMPFNKWGHPPSLLNSMSKHVHLIVCPMILKLNNLSIHWKDSSKCRKRYSINVWRTVKTPHTTHHTSRTTHHAWHALHAYDLEIYPQSQWYAIPIITVWPSILLRSIRASDGSIETVDYVDSFLDADHVMEVR